VRALRRHGFECDFLLSEPSQAPLPAIAGVRLRSLGNAGHFIAVLQRDGQKYVIADPMEGLSTNTLADLEKPYEFTGFFISIRWMPKR
jgi:ABC-type bacteriocin/lantibiotic exporter with double-glycine peptidase domain